MLRNLLCFNVSASESPAEEKSYIHKSLLYNLLSLLLILVFRFFSISSSTNTSCAYPASTYSCLLLHAWWSLGKAAVWVEG